MISAFFRAPENLPFLIALGIMLGFTIIAVVASWIGSLGDSGAEVDVDADVDTDLDVDFGESVMDFLGISAMPLSIYAFLSSSVFFFAGFLLQTSVYQSTQRFLSGWIAVLIALLVTVFAMKGISTLFRRAKVQIDTSAISADSLVGRMATIVSGTAKAGLAAEAKLTDEHGQTHYVLVEPAQAGEEFVAGTPVLLMERRGPRFLAVSGAIDDLLNLDAESLASEKELK